MKPFKERMKKQAPKVIQQSDYLKEFLLKIQNEGLHAAYLKYCDRQPRPLSPTVGAYPGQFSKEEDVEYDVIIVGAGMAGLAAAYELKRARLKVKILEQTGRYGGRVFTYGEDAGLAPGLYGEAGAMRLPGGVDEPNNRAHFLTDGYISDFQLPIKKFPNFDKKGISNIYGFKELTSNWKQSYFLTVWPKWRQGINSESVNVKDIDDYYTKTTGVVTDQLIAWLNKTTKPEEEIVVWGRWIDIWSQFTLQSFLESNVNVITAKLRTEDQDLLDLDMLRNLLPWSNDAIRGFTVFSYTPQLDQSLAQHLRDDLGNWWSHDMHTLVGGMHSLPEAFFSQNRTTPLVSDDLSYNQQVHKIEYHYNDEPTKDYVKVTCYATGNELEEPAYTARAVILTTQVNILRQITFEPIKPAQEDREALRKNLQAIEDMFTGPSTKIILQTKTRFWEDEKYGIHGGFSKTNLPIGQIHYVKPDPDYLASTQQGIILIYTWKNEALIFGSLTKEQAKKEAIEQVGEIHPEITEEGAVEKCIVHAWYNQPSYQGAYSLLKPTQFNNVRYLWEPMGNVHFAGENISLTACWIQGALESGFKSAYQVYLRHMKFINTDNI
ncbi:L-amino-acid oxidase-like [Dendronephthya gigantea]|uniref:L-amino-acid oxidase-like n=1 Tax=Dendronephthya gigantea TaxID=151771 RepID=UPI00106DBF8E|nr:L-amino-acid oxidase-like [Dendronephthya gigantea]